MIKILDSTLREGEQTPGVFFDNHIKLAISEMLEAIGVNIIESGHATVSAEIRDAVTKIAHSRTTSTVAAHARSLRVDVDAALECGVGMIGIFYCVSDDRLNDVFNNDLAAAIEQISMVIAYAREQSPELVIRYTPEDAVRSPFENVVAASAAAVASGANIISVADTTGYMVPGTDHNMYDYVTRLKTELADRGHHPELAVHCHNDRGLALANALDGYRGGATIIDATVLGLGERAGIVDLAQLISALTHDHNVDGGWNLELLPDLYRLVSEHAGIPIPVNMPLMGKNAFTHCAGVHTHAATKSPVHYQSIQPEIFGRTMEVALDHMSGLSSVMWELKRLELPNDDEIARKVLHVVKTVGQSGRTVHSDELLRIVKWCQQAADGEVASGKIISTANVAHR